eukprot:TRINITY_DN24598_c0_g1_i1.p1 TRINITY_DN24598_c0_g1~~TRINITY_DN24598_c0_g1_i1.p1  ORF type:complete len:283 (+),score=132.49 TRINITY_DN24598_c0_g1_i1:71-850(+)
MSLPQQKGVQFLLFVGMIVAWVYSSSRHAEDKKVLIEERLALQEKFQERTNEYDEAVKARYAELQRARQEVQALKEERHTTRDAKAELEAQLQAANDKVKDLTTTAKRCESSQKAARKRADEEADENDALQAKVEHLQELADASAANAAKLKRELQTKVEKARKEASEAQADVSEQAEELKTTVAEQTKQLNKLKRDTAELQVMLTDAEKTVADKGQQIKICKVDRELRERELEIKIQGLEEQVASLKKKKKKDTDDEA